MLRLAEIMRASTVKRWHIVNTSRTQSLAEHSFNVCFIARALCRHMGINDENVMKAALEHDLDEVVLGDLPTPFKKEMAKRGVKVDMAKMNCAPERELNPMERDVLKMADYIDAIHFLTENGVGQHANEVREGIADDLDRFLEGFPDRIAEQYDDILTKVMKELYG